MSSVGFGLVASLVGGPRRAASQNCRADAERSVPVRRSSVCPLLNRTCGWRDRRARYFRVAAAEADDGVAGSHGAGRTTRMGRASLAGPLVPAAAEDGWSCRSLAAATAIEAKTRLAEIAIIRKSKTIVRHPLLTQRTAELAKSS